MLWNNLPLEEVIVPLKCILRVATEKRLLD